MNDKEIVYQNTQMQLVLGLIKRIYQKRDEVLQSSNNLLEIADEIDACGQGNIRPIITKAEKEINTIISNVHELSPHLQNPSIAEGISKQAKLLLLQMEQAKHERVLNGVVSLMIKASICQDANRTILRPTPKSIKQAFGITISPRDIKFLFEHQQDNF